MLALALAVPAFAAGGFSDVPGSHWAYSDIMACAEAGIVSGFADGTFKLNNNVTYVEFLVMLTRTFYNSKVEAVKDTAGKPWYYPYTQAARDVGLDKSTDIVNKGGWPTIVVANNAINRYEMAVVIKNILGYEGKVLQYTTAQLNAATTALSDWSKIPSTYQAAIKYSYASGVIMGNSDGTFGGTGSMTRAQACAVIIRLMDLINTPTPAMPVQPQQPETPAVTGTGKLANGQPATVENVHAILEEIKKEYPSETVWGPPNIPNNNYYKDGPLNDNETNRDVVVLNNNFKSDSSNGRSRTSLVYACGGWACMVSERIFGKTGAPCREVTDVSEIRPGDIVYYFTSKDLARHVAIIYGVDMRNGVPYLRTCDGNVAATVRWEDPVPDSTYTEPLTLGKENASETGGYYRIFTRYPD